MKAKNILSIPFFVIIIYSLSSCCKDGDCKDDFRNQYVGTYITQVVEVRNLYHDTTKQYSVILKIEKVRKIELSIDYGNIDVVGCEKTDQCKHPKEKICFSNDQTPDYLIGGSIEGTRLNYYKEIDLRSVDNQPYYTKYYTGIKQ
jgi:hypothetical protein